jgi:hypothetical protein
MKVKKKTQKQIRIYKILKWKLRGFNRKEAIEWIKGGYTLPEAIHFKKQGSDFKSAEQRKSDE